MANRFYTIMVVPEKTSEVRKIIVPSWLLRGGAIASAFLVMLGALMFSNYWQVMSQIDQNKQLKMENRRLKQQVQIFQNKLTSIESTMERVKTFATRLKVITNIEGRGVQSSVEKLPEAATNIGNAPAKVDENGNKTSAAEPLVDPKIEIAAVSAPLTSGRDALQDPDEVLLRREYDQLDTRFTLLNRDALGVEQVLQDQYELLADQKAFLAALPMRKPTVGYFTSGFGVRKSPFNDRVKMHEGLDIANYPGTAIKAPADGVVLFAGPKTGYGQTLILDHGYGLETWYAHTRKIVVSKGQKVKTGETIALLGNTGQSTGPHLHYEVRINGTPVDPLTYILEN